MDINNDMITKAVKTAFESKGIKSIPGVEIDDLVKSIVESVMKSVDVKAIGGSLLSGLSKNITGK